MARRSDYPFRKSDMKYGNNLIALLFSIPISLGAKAVIDGSKDLLSTFPNGAANFFVWGPCRQSFARFFDDDL